MSTKQALVTIIRENTAQSYDLPEPASYSGTTSTVIDSGTSVSGKLLGAVVREDVAKVSLSWRYLTAAQWAKINEMFKATGSGSRFINKVSFFDQTCNRWQTRDMFVSDRSAGMWRRGEDGGVLGWTDCSLELTEV